MIVNVGIGVRVMIRSFKQGDLGRSESEMGGGTHGGGEMKTTVRKPFVMCAS